MVKAIVLLLLISTLSPAVATAENLADTLPYGSRAGMQVTIVERRGIDTDRAVIRVKHTRRDAVAFCRDYAQTTARDCIATELKVQLADRITADCRAGVFTNLNGEKRRFRRDGTLVDTTTGDELDQDMASGYYQDVEQLRALCPALFR